MSINDVNLYVNSFNTNLLMLAQQQKSRLRNLIMNGTQTGVGAAPVDQVGIIEMSEVVDRYAPVVRTDAVTDRRWVSPADFDLAQMVDNFDKLRMLNDPTSTYVQAAVAAANRKFDQLIINAAFATAKTGVNGGTNTTFPSGQVVSVIKGSAAASGLTVAKLREAKRILMANEVDTDVDELTLVVTATDHDNLLGETQIISSEYNPTDRPVLQDGKIERFLGINFIHSEKITSATDDQSGTSRQLPLFAKSGMYLGIWKEINSDISQRKDLKGLPWQIYTMMSANATRLEEKKVVKIWCR